MESSNYVALGIWVSLIAAFIGFVGLYLTYQAVKETRLAAQAQVATALLDSYASDFVLEDTEHLKQWKTDHPEDPAGDFVELRNAGDKEARRVDRARRHVAHYLQKAAMLGKKELIDRALLRAIISENQVAFASDFVEELDVAVTEAIGINPDPHSVYRELRALHGMHEPYPAKPASK